MQVLIIQNYFVFHTYICLLKIDPIDISSAFQIPCNYIPQSIKKNFFVSMVMLSDTVPPTLPSHTAFLPEFPSVGNWPTTPMVATAIYKYLFFQSCLTYLPILFKPWCSQLCDTAFRQKFLSFIRQRTDFMAIQPCIMSGSYFCFIPCPQCAILWVCKGALHVMQVSSPFSQNASIRKRKSTLQSSSHLWWSWRETPAELHQ